MPKGHFDPFDPMTSKSLKVFKFELDMITSQTCKFSFFIRSAEASSQIGEMLRFCDFYRGWLVNWLAIL